MTWTWEDDCAREWERQNEPADIDGCRCKGGPNTSECKACRALFCADCMQHACPDAELDYIWAEETQTDDEITHTIRFRKAGLKKRGAIIVSGWEWEDFKQETE